MRTKVFLITLVLLFLFSCNKAFERKKTLIVLLSGQIHSIHPFFASSYDEIVISRLIAQGLFYYDSVSRKIRNEIIQKYSVSPDGRTWFFYLKHGRVLSNGKQLNAEAVVMTYRSLFKSSPKKLYYSNVIRAAAVKEYVVRIDLRNPDYEFDVFLSGRNGTGIFHDLKNRGIIAGYGPYILKSFSSNKIILERNPHYKDGTVETERIVFKIIPDEQMRLKMLLNREADIGIIGLTENLIRVQANPFLRIEKNLNPDKLLLTGSSYPFDKHAIRQAIFGHSLSRNKISYTVYSGFAAPEVNIFPEHSIYYRKQEYLMFYNPTESANIIQANNLRNFTFDLYLPDSVPRLKVALKQWTAELLKAGIKVRLSIVTEKKLTALIKSGNYQAAMIKSNLWLIHPRDIRNYFEIFNSRLSNNGLFPEEALSLIDKGVQTSSSARKNLFYFNAMKSIASYSRITGVIVLPSYFAASNRVQNFSDLQRGRLERVRVYR